MLTLCFLFIQCQLSKLSIDCDSLPKMDQGDTHTGGDADAAGGDAGAAGGDAGAAGGDAGAADVDEDVDDEDALKQSKKIKFKPAEHDGQQIDSEATVHIIFELAS